MEQLVIAVDFDGTICENKFPEIGDPFIGVILKLIDLKNMGHKLILWTCRRDDRLEEAVRWCEKYKLFFDAVNNNLPENIVAYGGDTRKIAADYYIDDKNSSLDLIPYKVVEYTREEIDQFVEDIGSEGVVVFENPDYASAFVGVTTDNRAVYSYERMVQHLIKTDDITEIDAREFIDYNTIRSLPYVTNSPLILIEV